MTRIVSPEAADNTAGTCGMLPTLALAVPGSGTAAVLLGGLMIWGVTPGPMLFVQRPDVVWGLIASMYMSNLLGLVVVLTMAPLFASILRAPFAYIGQRGLSLFENHPMFEIRALVAERADVCLKGGPPG